MHSATDKISANSTAHVLVRDEILKHCSLGSAVSKGSSLSPIPLIFALKDLVPALRQEKKEKA